MSRPHLIVFDLDGTLVDSRRDLAEAANTLLAQCGAAALPEAAIGRMVGDGAATLVARVFAAAGIERPSEALARFLQIYNGRLLRFTRPYAGMAEVLAELSTRAALAVLTNKPLRATREILDGLELARFFPPERVLGGDGPLPRKPDPAALLQLVTSVPGADGAAVLVGDSIVDWQTGCAAGTDVCLARYGFGFEGFPTEVLRPGDRVVDSPRELLTAL